MKKFAAGLYVAVTLVLMIWGYYQAVYVAPLDAMQGEISRIFYYHVPIAMLFFLFFAISLAGSIGYLTYRRSRPDWAQTSDAWALAGAEVGVLYCSVVLTTGPLWGRRAWPQQISSEAENLLVADTRIAPKPHVLRKLRSCAPEGTPALSRFWVRAFSGGVGGRCP